MGFDRDRQARLTAAGLTVAKRFGLGSIEDASGYLTDPSLGLAPLIVREVFQIVSRLRAMGVAVLLVEQNARAALQVADRAYVLEMGAVVLTGQASELLYDRRIIDTYLGVGGHRSAES